MALQELGKIAGQQDGRSEQTEQNKKEKDWLPIFLCILNHGWLTVAPFVARGQLLVYFRLSSDVHSREQ